MNYDYLIVGSGLFGSTFAYEATKQGKSCIVIEKRNHIGGNIFSTQKDNIVVHMYGPHIFHTNSKITWEYINQFSKFNSFINTPLANYKGQIFNLPLNMHTFNQFWGVVSPTEAKLKISEITKPYKKRATNLEEKAISLVGKEIYEKLIKGYTEKQWGKSCRELPSEIIDRIPFRFTYNNNYYNDIYQGVPIEGYTSIISKMLDGSKVILNTDFLKNMESLKSKARKVIYTGAIDAYFNFCYGPLDYRSLRFETEFINTSNYQGVAVMNYTDYDTPYTRIIEHKYFDFKNQHNTIITKEFPTNFIDGKEPFYPINDRVNQKKYKHYKTLVAKERNVYFGGRLGEYKYYDMDETIQSAINLATLLIKN